MISRLKQLEFCKKCTKREFDFKQGTICSLTNQKADFDGECKHFEIDSVKIDSINEKRQSKKKSRIAYGFSPKQIDDIAVSNLTNKQAFVYAYHAAKILGWNIGFLSKSGFIAYTKLSMTSWSEEVQFKIEVGNINIKSECTGNQLIDWGKNRRNIEKFNSAFVKAQTELKDLNIEQEYTELKKSFASEEEDIINSPLTKKEGISGIFSLIRPTKGYFITPIIVLLNILIYIVMVSTGVHWIMPSNDSLLLWGANFQPLTLEGEWWRLISSTFIHIGVFHLLMNMYALVYIGLLLEPYLGRSRFLSAYLLSGIAGSVTSLYWNDLTISAGASGAIFGMYGVFVALLTTKLIEKSARKPLLISIGVFVVYSLANGLKGGIDNAAHIGGLISGLIIGYSFYPSLVKTNPILKPLTIGALTLLIAISSFSVIENTSTDIIKYENDMEIFYKLEDKAMGVYNLSDDATDQQFLDEIQNNGINSWKECLKLMEEIDNYDLPEIIHYRNTKLKEYCRLRIESYELIYKAILEQTDKYDSEINDYTTEINTIIDELTQNN